jgi:simple sugar transport system ATP-binding protein
VSEDLVHMKGITKTFGQVQALKNVDFRVQDGEIVGLIGDNGAGKSTLIKILTGVFPPDSGEIFFDGAWRRFATPADARHAGIETVHQGYGVLEDMSIARNFFLGREPLKRVAFLRVLDNQMMNRECSKVLKEIGINVRSPEEVTRVLSGGERQAVNIGRAIHFKAKLVVLDEPTTALSVKESEHILQFIEDVRQAGSSVIFITHNIHHVYRAADRFVLLNRGQIGGEWTSETVTAEEIINIMSREQ